MLSAQRLRAWWNDAESLVAKNGKKSLLQAVQFRRRGVTSMQSVSRRGFIAVSLTAASAARVLGANDRIRVGIVGVRARGSYLVEQANRVGGIE